MLKTIFCRQMNFKFSNLKKKMMIDQCFSDIFVNICFKIDSIAYCRRVIENELFKQQMNQNLLIVVDWKRESNSFDVVTHEDIVDVLETIVEHRDDRALVLIRCVCLSFFYKRISNLWMTSIDDLFIRLERRGKYRRIFFVRSFSPVDRSSVDWLKIIFIEDSSLKTNNNGRSFVSWWSFARNRFDGHDEFSTSFFFLFIDDKIIEKSFS